jgi:lysophospholipase L1-like esterase
MRIRRGLLGLLLLAASGAVLAHRSQEPAVLGRYSIAYSVLAAIFVASSGLFFRLLRPGTRSSRAMAALVGAPSFGMTLFGLATGLFLLSLALAGSFLAAAVAVLLLGACGIGAGAPPSRAARVGEALSSASLVFAGLVAGLGAAEAAARVLWRVPLPLHRDAYPERYRLNAHGLRDRERTLRKLPGTRRLVALGDSVTWGWGVRREETFASVLERSLAAAASGARTEVLNVSRPGANTVEEVRMLEATGLSFEPDVVLLAFVLNDPETAPASGTALPAWRSALRRSRLELMLEWALLARGLPTHAEYDRHLRSLFDPESEGWKACVAALGKLARLGRERAFRPAVVVFPLPVDAPAYPYVGEHRQVAASCATLGLPVLDLQEEFDEEGLAPGSLDVGDGHPSALGHEKAAAAILRFLEARSLLGSDPRSRGSSGG